LLTKFPNTLKKLIIPFFIPFNNVFTNTSKYFTKLYTGVSIIFTILQIPLNKSAKILPIYTIKFFIGVKIRINNPHIGFKMYLYSLLQIKTRISFIIKYILFIML